MAVAAIGTGVALAVVGSGAKGQIDRSLDSRSSPPTSSLRAGELKGLEQQTNGAFTGALVSGIAAAVFTAVSVYCFASAP